MQSENILKDAIAEARTLRKLSMSNARHSLVKFLKEEKLPLDDLADAELDLDTFVDLIIKRSRERDKEEDELNPSGLPYLNCKHKLRKPDNESELDERGRFNMYGEVDDVEFEYGDEIDDDKDADDTDDDDNFSNKVVEERSRKWQNLYGRRNFRTSPIVRPTKITKKERELLIKHAGLLKENKNFRQSTATKDDLLRQRAGISKSDKNLAKNVINDLEIKKKLSK